MAKVTEASMNVEVEKADFREMMQFVQPGLLRLDKLQTLQINLGNRCNMSCKHCHVGGGPNGKKIMLVKVMDQIFSFLDSNPNLTVDVTGGCPEMNPDFIYFAEGIRKRATKFMVRTNLTVFFESGLEYLPKWYRDHKVAIVASMPCYTRENVDSQRGPGTFDKSIKALKILNELGYGKDNDLQLDLVYNPGQNFLPGDQSTLQSDYKRHLNDEHGIVFNNLFTITNAPIGRFAQDLRRKGNEKDYILLLAGNFNPAAAKQIMCRSLLSVDYRGVVYNCDFNQAVDLPIIDSDGQVVTIETLQQAMDSGIEIITADHCFSCTAGHGSSCSGSLA